VATRPPIRRRALNTPPIRPRATASLSRAITSPSSLPTSKPRAPLPFRRERSFSSAPVKVSPPGMPKTASPSSSRSSLTSPAAAYSPFPAAPLFTAS
jgi:hypothetical protein